MRGKIGISQKIVGSRTLRTVCSLLFILNTIVLIFSAQGFAFLKNNGFYTTNGKQLSEQVTDQLMDKSSHDALLYFGNFMVNIRSDQTQSEIIKEYESAFSEENCNFAFSFWQHGEMLYRNYELQPDEIGRDNKRDLEDLIDGEGYAPQIENWDGVTFEGHLKKTLTAHDMYWRAERFFHWANTLKYVVFGLMLLFAVLECVFGFVQFTAIGHIASVRERDLDQIPLYLLIPFWAMFCTLCIFFLRRQTAALSDLAQVFSGTELRPTLYMYVLLLLVLALFAQTLLTTVSVRVHRPMWWRRSILYRTFAARSFGQRVRTVLTVTAALQFALYLVVYLVLKHIPRWIYFAADGAFVLTMTLLLYVIFKDMSVYIPQTRRIAAEQSGSVSTDGLSDSGRAHADNINFLSRSASTETEKRFINESFSTELIHSVSDGLREPLRDVAENVRLLQKGTLSESQSHACVARIVSLSQELKKTIEDMILISKASTGNLPLDPVPTDAGMMLAQAAGEFHPQFVEKDVEPVVEQPEKPVLIRADGQYMWYVFEGILSVMLENAVAGTRLFMRTDLAGGNAVIVFRCTVRAQARRQIRELSGMGLSSAKVFTILQGGTMVDRLSYDVLTAVLQFPAILS